MIQITKVIDSVGGQDEGPVGPIGRSRQVERHRHSGNVLPGVLLGGLVNVGLTLALVPLFEATGTAISVAVTETAIWIALALLLRRRALDVFRLT